MFTSCIRLLLAGDHSVMYAGFRRLIDAQPDMQTVGEAEDACATLNIASDVQPDVILLALSMLHVRESQLVHDLHDRVPKVKVLVLSMQTEEEYLLEALRLGAAGYIVLSADDQELLAAIRAVARGDVYIHPSVTRSLLEDLLPEISTHDDAWETLSDREQQVIRRVVFGYTNREIAEFLYLSVKTVETYRSRGMEKLGIHTRAQLVKYAMHRGLLVSVSGEEG